MSKLEHDIYAQPEALELFLKESRGKLNEAAGAMRGRSPHLMYLVARGSSENVARYAQYALGEKAGIPVAIGNPSLFTRYSRHPRLIGAITCGISQSGGSPDITAVIKEARRQGSFTIAITNEPTSPLAESAQLVITTRARESSIAATQTYINSIAAVAFLAALVAGDRPGVEELRSVPDSMAKTLEHIDDINTLARTWASSDRSFVVGRGYNYATAHEISLKLKELTYTVAHPYSSAEFLHGPIAVLEKGIPVLLVAPTGAVSQDVPELIGRLAESEANITVVTDSPQADQPGAGFLKVQQCPEWLSPLVSVIPGQLLALRICECKSIDPDRPRGLEKVTETF